jgi:hypothetical protein
MAGLEQVNPEGGIRMSLLTLRKATRGKDMLQTLLNKIGVDILR